MTKFAYNNAKNASISNISFELNCKYYFYMPYKKNIDSYSKSKLVNILLIKLQKLIKVFCKNLYYNKKLQKKDYDNGIQLKSYVFSNKIWLNSKYFKTKQNRKLEIKVFEPF